MLGELLIAMGVMDAVRVRIAAREQDEGRLHLRAELLIVVSLPMDPP